MARKEIIADDVTGRDLTGDDSRQAVKVTFNGKSATLDLSAETADALADLFAGNGADKLRDILAPASATPAGKPARSGGSRSGSRKAGDSPASKAREWARETPAGKAWVKAQGADYHIPERGRATGLVAAWEAAGSPETAASAAPAGDSKSAADGKPAPVATAG